MKTVAQFQKEMKALGFTALMPEAKKSLNNMVYRRDDLNLTITIIEGVMATERGKQTTYRMEAVQNDQTLGTTTAEWLVDAADFVNDHCLKIVAEQEAGVIDLTGEPERWPHRQAGPG